MIAWLNPAAFAALALLAGPVLVHLLLRHRAERIPFPSLRFVRPSRTAAVRLRRPSDLALLLLRVGIVALAVAALAQPLLLVGPRVAAWNARTARAIVVDVSDSMRASGGALSEAADAARAEGQGTVFTARIDAATLGSGVLQAVGLLVTAPPARREIVIVSDFQRGALSRADLDAVPAAIGIRLVQVGAAAHERRIRGLELFQPGNIATQEILLAGPATSVTVGHESPAFQVRLKPDATGTPTPSQARPKPDATGTVRPPPSPQRGYGEPRKPDATGLRLVAGEGGSVALEKLERAVSAAGAPAPSPDQPLAIGFAGHSRDGAVRGISEIWMLETVRRMRNDRDLMAACSDSGTPTLEAVSKPLVASGFHPSAHKTRAGDPGFHPSAHKTRAGDPGFGRTMPVLKPSPGSRRPGAAPPASDRTGTAWYVLCRDAESRPTVRAAASGSTLVLDVEAPPSALLSAAVVRAALTARHGSVARPEEEIQRMTAAELTGWSRQAPPVAAEAWRSGHSAVESDSRWIWALVLALLAVESIVRRRTGGRRTDAPHEVRADAA